MFQEVIIAPSILSANFINLQKDLDAIAQGGAKFVHVDVMDGHFVPNLTMGVPLVKQLKKATDLVLDVHLMIDNPAVQVPWFLAAGADIITCHIESFKDADEVWSVLRAIKEAGVKCALSIKPDTPVSALEPYIEALDMVLVMSVYPGFSGQKYIEGSHQKVADVVAMARQHGVAPLIEVDGGMGPATLGCVVEQGADVLVAGNAAFGQDGPQVCVSRLLALANGVA